MFEFLNSKCEDLSRRQNVGVAYINNAAGGEKWAVALFYFFDELVVGFYYFCEIIVFSEVYGFYLFVI